MNARRNPSSPIAKWLPVGAAGGLLALVVAAGVISGSGNDDSTAMSLPSVDPSAVASTLPATLTELPPDGPLSTETYDAVEQGTESVVKVPLTRTLVDGVAGDDVTRLQQRLADLAFDPGPVDGIYGTMTKQAVWAFEKLVMGSPRSEATGQVTAEMWVRMQDPIVVKPRRPTGGLADHTEVYLPEQVMVVFNKDVPELVAHIASGELDSGGKPAKYCDTVLLDTDAQGNSLDPPVEKAICGFSKTPPGVFTAYRKIEGIRNGPLGSMFDPIYINYGIAIHGAYNVPLEPASHGCIRVNRYIGEYLQTILELDDQVLIWDGIKEPEEQSDRDMLPVWDFPDPDATTTTTTTTTTAPSTTVPAPATTPPVTNPVTTPAPTTSATTTTSSTTTTTTTVPTSTSTTSATVAPVDNT
ncbi:MAG: peptidoglycan-binding protein [Ilumatobacter sp.]